MLIDIKNIFFLFIEMNINNNKDKDTQNIHFLKERKFFYISQKHSLFPSFRNYKNLRKI